MMKYCLLLLLLFLSCKEDKNKRITNLVEDWNNREILFSSELQFTSLGKGMPSLLNKKWDFAIVSYTDSIGCTSCKLQLNQWKNLINQIDSISEKKVEILLFMHPSKREELLLTLKDSEFDYPVCIDDKDVFNKLNSFPSDMAFQTFLVDKNNKVLAIGNPVHNLKMRDLYFNIIQNRSIEVPNNKDVIQTIVSIDKKRFSLGNFDWQKVQKMTFSLKNIGNKPLLVEGVDTSCGCISVSYSKEPVQPGHEISVNIAFKADHPEYFNKTITVYCNSEVSPIKLTISGNAK